MQKVILFVALLAFAGVASAASFETLSTMWSAWKGLHNKAYAADEETARFAIFADNYHKIQRLNAQDSDVKYALNKFADLTGHEFKVQYASSGFAATDKKLIAEKTKSVIVGGLPDEVDWRNKGAVTPVKDQGQCGSCWSFSTTGVIEGFYFLNNGKLLSFSEQQIVDCDTDDGNEGCNGGWPYLAVEYAAQNGLELESDYPYTAEDGDCVYDKSKATQVAGGYSFVTPNSTDELKSALVNSPVSVLVEADQDSFQFYDSGVLKTGCGANLDHAVLAVGYQKVGVLEAFIVKNSWGTTWGDSGYIFIWSDGKANQGQGVCGILAQPMIATK